MPPTTSDTELLVQFRNPLTKEKAFTSIIKKYQEKLYWHEKKMNSKASPVSMRASVFFSINSVATTNAANEKPITRIVDGNPSLYITIKKEK